MRGIGIGVLCLAAMAASAASAAPSLSESLQAICMPLIEKKSTAPGIAVAQKLGWTVKGVKERGLPLETVMLSGPGGELSLTLFNGGICTVATSTSRYAPLVAEFDAWAAKAPGGPYKKGAVGADEEYHRGASWTGPRMSAELVENFSDDESEAKTVLYVELKAARP